MDDTPVQVTRNKTFYCETVVFKVEDELFRVPKRDFVDSSEVFSDMFLLPTGNDMPIQEGSDDGHPIELMGYDKGDFASLLKVFSPSVFWSKDAVTRAPLGITLAKEEWISVLKLSTAWIMPKIRAYAIERLDGDFTLRPAERLKIGRLYKISTWIRSALASLLKIKSLSLDDLEGLDWETKESIFDMDIEQKPGQYGVPVKDIHCNCTVLYPQGTFPSACNSCVQPISAQTRFHWATPKAELGLVVTELRALRCRNCGNHPVGERESIKCGACPRNINRSSDWWVRLSLLTYDQTVEKHFGDEIREAEAAWRNHPEPGIPCPNQKV